MFQHDKIGMGYGMLGLFQDPTFVAFNGKAWTLDETALTKHLKTIASAGANFVRLMPWGVWGSHPGQKKVTQFQPYVLKKVGTRELWDLATFNTYYFPIVKRVFEIINGLNMTVLWDWFDNCQFHGIYKKWSPWANNIQGITTFYGKDADIHTRRWIFNCLFEFTGLDVIWGFGNELNNRAFPEMAKRVIFPIVKSKKLDVNRLTYGATDDPIQDAVRDIAKATLGGAASRSIILEYHGWSPVSFPKDARVMYSDDGFYGGKPSCDKDTWGGTGRGYRPSPAEWGTKVKGILAKYPSSAPGRPRLLSFEHLPTGGEYGNPDCQALWFKAISVEHFKKFKVWPKNYKAA